MIDIKKASAGSGKTYQLAETYLKCLAESGDENAYRHILAVTFTNKATAEMKSRILRRLYEKAAEDPRSERILVSILHDYSAFSVSTIDKFFQQVLRSFACELGYFSAYQVELDTPAVVRESVDRLLDGITENDKELIDWLDEIVVKQLSEGKRLYLENDLYSICGLLRTLRQSPEVLSKENLAKKRAECIRIIEKFNKRTYELAPELAKDAGRLGKIPYPKVTDFKKASSEAQAHFLEGYKLYNTAQIILPLTYTLGIARDYYASQDALTREKNIMCLDDSTTILKGIIDGSDAPFVYEKLGVRYRNFLLDEFQDTSDVQWDNFYPLLKESNDNGNSSLIVGDVKQSIYRWRGSDWRLLASRLPSQFPGASITPLDGNWRSCSQIVEFNNRFFEYAAAQLGLSDLYSDVRQKVKAKDPAPGMVQIEFVPDAEQLDTLFNCICQARVQGARYSDIAVLVRANKEGATVAEYLIGKGLPVITDDSLDAKASVTVRRLVALLECLDNKDNTISSFYAQSLDMQYPQAYHSLTDLCEYFLRSLLAQYPQEAAGEVLHIQSFMDNLQDWVSVNGNNLAAFLKYWKDAKVKISSPPASDSIRVITVHKSKGLEFPYVIFPFADKVDLYQAGDVWCAYDGVRYPVKLYAGTTANSCFDKDLEVEQRMQAIDNLNIFYVALTRAVNQLTVIAKEPAKSFRDAVDKGKALSFTNMSQVLFAYAKTTGFLYGTPYDFNSLERQDNTGNTIQGDYLSIPVGFRLPVPDDSSDFFSEDGIGTKVSPRINGIVLHDILSQVGTIEDLREAVDAAVRDGLLPQEDAERDYALLQDAILAHPEWFGPGLSSLNEVSIIGEDGQLHRPDRVVSGPDGTVVVDYKFGAPRQKYRSQVQEYVRLYRKMGYKNVTGCLWYVPENRTEVF